MTEAVSLEALLTASLGRLPMRRVHGDVVIDVDAGRIVEVCRQVKADPELALDFVRCLSGVDRIDHLEVVYHLYSTQHRHRVVFKVRLPADNPVVDSVTSVWRGADWHEREAMDMFGITFRGHPNPKPLLLEEGMTEHPLLKGYQLEEMRKIQ